MAAPKIFITGVTGYIGGDILYALEKSHPEYDITALVRNTDKAAPVAAAYPKIHFAYGSLDDHDIIEDEASKADIVIHTADASDNEGAAKAIAKGIEKGHSKEKPGFWLHVSGTGILTWADSDSKTFGEPLSYRPYDDLEHVSELTSLPDSAFHRDIDKIVLAAASDATKVAIVCPPTIYGDGRGPGNQSSRQVVVLVKTALEQGKTPKIGRGLSEWDHVHVNDLADLFVLLAEAAAKNDKSLDSKLWGKDVYYLAENGNHVWGDVSKWVAEDAYKKGFLKSEEVEAMDPDKAKEIAGFEALSWGLNSRGQAKRAREYLGWKPHGRSLKDSIPLMVDAEAKEQGLVKGYAEKAAGKA